MLTPKEWTYQEHWVWEKIKKGEEADFNKADGYGGNLDPIEIENKNRKARILRPEFLQTILLKKEYVKHITRKGIDITGAWIKDPLDLSHTIIDFPLGYTDPVSKPL